MEKLLELVKICDSFERELIDEMIESAATYVKAVVKMEATALNILGIEGNEFREARTSTDRSRTLSHNGFISLVNAVNRICEKHNVSPIYTGSDERREYGDYAIKIVNDIFVDRH